MAPKTSEAHHLAAEFRTALRRIEHLVRQPRIELEDLMKAIDNLRALEPRVDAVIAAMSNDTATAVANAVAPLNEQITTLQAAATQAESDLQAEVDALTAKVVTLETGVGITFTPPAAPGA